MKPGFFVHSPEAAHAAHDGSMSVHDGSGGGGLGAGAALAGLGFGVGLAAAVGLVAVGVLVDFGLAVGVVAVVGGLQTPQLASHSSCINHGLCMHSPAAAHSSHSAAVSEQAARNAGVDGSNKYHTMAANIAVNALRSGAALRVFAMLRRGGARDDAVQVEFFEIAPLPIPSAPCSL